MCELLEQLTNYTTPSLRPESLTNERFRFDSIILFGNNDDDTVELKQSSLSLSIISFIY